MLSTICSRFLKVAGMAAVVIGGIAVVLGVAERSQGNAGMAASGTEEVAATSDTIVLYFDGAADPLRRLTILRQDLRRHPGNAKKAAIYAELALRHYARLGDARLLGYAEGALAPWQDTARPPLAIWLLRGRILQTQHRFADSATEMDRFLDVHTDSIEATLLAADAWRRAGDLGRSRAHCARLAFLGRGDLSRYCAADLFLSLGQQQRAAMAVSSLEKDLATMPPATARWALAIAAEVAAASGDNSQATKIYERALATGDAEMSLRVAYADLLLDMGRAEEALAVLASEPEADAVLLRRAIAARRLGNPRFDEWRKRLDERFAIADRLGGDKLHLRERALFELYVAADPDAALELAIENWQRQKGSEDASLLQASARAADRSAESRIVDDWRAGFDADHG